MSQTRIETILRRMLKALRDDDNEGYWDAFEELLAAHKAVLEAEPD